ncbi:esterase [Actinoplanes siamensis]|uniref:Esterase n=1 Tax=Actinoplanes siamensis TaxID=1223317 RepID=A0A919N0C7_9ACTN|nr:esterase [Actinoplanes siamensis]
MLVGGLWTDAAVWDRVVPELEARGRRAAPVRLTGRTLDEQVSEVLAVVDAAPGPAVVAGHSAAAALAWMAADARPGRVVKVVLIGGWPKPDGTTYAAFFEITGGVMPFPGWAAFEGPDSADLDEQARAAFAAAAVPVPEGVARGVVRLRDERRYDLPVTLVCPEFDPDDVRSWIAEGELPELARIKHLDLVDIDSGHWPMLTRPAELAGILAAV